MKAVTAGEFIDKIVSNWKMMPIARKTMVNLLVITIVWAHQILLWRRKDMIVK
jgi:hypothetical protein